MNETLKKIFDHLNKVEEPIFSIDDLKEVLDFTSSEISEGLFSLSDEGKITFIIKSPKELYLTHINGEEINWEITHKKENPGKTLFDREGNVYHEITGFYEYIGTLPESTKERNLELFKELDSLSGQDYADKVQEIAVNNIKLIRRIVFPILENDDLIKDELIVLYKHILRSLCRAVEKFDFKQGFTFGTYSAWWIFQGAQRAQSIIVRERLNKKYGNSVGISVIDEKTRDLKKKLDRYPHLNEVTESLVERVKEKIKEQEKREAKREEIHFNKLGINKLYSEIIKSEIVVEPTKEEVILLYESISLLDDREQNFITLRYGLNESTDDYGTVLEEIGQEHGLTRERVRQIINKSIEKLQFFYNQEETDQIPLIFFPRDIVRYIEKNGLTTYSSLTNKVKSDFLKLEYGSPNRVNQFISILGDLGFDVPEKKDGEIDFSKLSARSRNVLIKNGILLHEDLIKLNKNDLNNLSNLGKKSIEEIEKYIEENLVDNKINFDEINKVLLFPCSNKNSQNNFEITMDTRVPIRALKKNFLEKQYSELSERGEAFFFWGIKSIEPTTWMNIPEKSLGIFFANKEAFAVGEICYKFINEDLSKIFWGLDSGTQEAFKYMFAIKNVKKIKIPQKIINESAGYKEGNYIQGFTSADELKSYNLKNTVKTHLT